MSVDEGLDIVATKNNKLYNMQVKTSNKNDYGSFVNDMRISSYVRHNQGNNFIIFVLRDGKETTFVILPYGRIEEDKDKGNIPIVANNTRYRFKFTLRDNELYLGRLNNPITHFKDNWDVIR